MFGGFLLGKNAALHGEQESGAADSGAVAGLAALLLAFSFSLAANRYDQRNTLIFREANSIRDTWLRADLLEEPTRGRIQQLLRDYLDARLNYIGAGFNPTLIGATAMASQHLQQQIWQVISEQSRVNQQPGNVSTMVPTVSDDRRWRGDRGGVFEHCACNCAHFVIRGDHFYWSAGRTFIWPLRASLRVHGRGFRIARDARGISNPGSRPPAKRSDSGKLRSVGKLAINGAGCSSPNFNRRSDCSSNGSIKQPTGLVPRFRCRLIS
jgi:hypothetical protein